MASSQVCECKIGKLSPREVRWMYFESRWIPFNGYDSLRIEQRHTLLTSGADLPDDVVNEKIFVREGLYELDILNKVCEPIYWHKEVSSCEVRRCTWFLKSSWQPLDEDLSQRLEAEHLKLFEGERVIATTDNETSSSKNKVVVHTMTVDAAKILWYSHAEVWRVSEARYTHRAYHFMAQKAGLKSGDRLCRGYILSADMSEKPADVTHLVLCIHGIGQMMQPHKIVKCCHDLRTNMRKLLSESKVAHWRKLARADERIEFLPLEWRTELPLNEGTIQSITPNNVKGIRRTLNSSALDVLYYSSPLYRQHLVDALRLKLNQLYEQFCECNPRFKERGKVSILAHSLGAVLVHDILTNYNPFSTYSRAFHHELRAKCEGGSNADEAKRVADRLEESNCQFDEIFSQVSHDTLNFKLDKLYLVGSPLSVYLAMRGLTPTGHGSQEDVLPVAACRRIFNIFHPSDPVAYRLEPLVLKHYNGIQPLKIHRNEQTECASYESAGSETYASGNEQEMTSPQPDEHDDASGSDHRRRDGARKRFIKRRIRNIASLSGELAELEETLSEFYDDEDDDDSSSSSKRGGGNNSYSRWDKTELEFRLDYELNERGLYHPYLAVLTSHTSYWSNMDVVAFIISQEFPDIVFTSPPAASPLSIQTDGGVPDRADSSSSQTTEPDELYA